VSGIYGEYNLNTFGCRAFVSAGPTVWNEIHCLDVIQLSETTSFDITWKTFQVFAQLFLFVISGLEVLLLQSRYTNAIFTYLFTYLVTYYTDN